MFSLSYIDIILLIGATQGLFLAVLILQKHGRLFANRFLGGMMLLYGVIFLHLIGYDTNAYRRFPQLLLIPSGLPLLSGPFHYLYARYLMEGRSRFRKTDWLHFLPLLLYECTTIPDFLKSPDVFNAALQASAMRGVPLRFVILNGVLGLQALSYMAVIIWRLRRYTREIEQVFSNLEKIKLNWLRNVTFMGTSGWLFFLIEYVLLLTGEYVAGPFNFSNLVGAIYVYALGYLGLSKSEIFAAPMIRASMSQLPPSDDTSSSLPAVKVGKYEKSGLTEAKAKQYLAALQQLMESEKPYTNSELTLLQLAEMLVISPHNLSEIINTQLQLNFFDFVNGYRVEKARRDLIDPTKQHLKILSIAFEAGFNSKTAFNTIFKKFTNLTPSEYRQRFGSMGERGSEGEGGGGVDA